MDAAGWRRRGLGLIALQPGQGVRTLLTALHLYLVIAAYLVLKSASKSLFLESFGARRLPQATILVALSVGLFVALYIRASRRVAAPVLISGTLALFVSNLLLFWGLDRIRWPWVYPVFYVWVGTYGVIVATQVWTLANEVFTTREAKRAFGVVGAGGIAGAISGGVLTGSLARAVGTANLLLVAAGLLVGAIVLVRVLARHRLQVRTRTDDLPVPRQLRDSLRLVRNSPHLRLVAALVLVTALATKMVDWQFNAVAEEAFPQRDARTAFFGTFDAATGLIGLLVQSLLTSRLLILIGLGGTILVFPLALTAGTLALIPTLSLWAAVLARGSDGTLKHSIDRASRELVYLPVSRSIKTQVKSAIDMVVDRAGDGLAGGVQWGVIALLSLYEASQLAIVRQMALVNLLFLGAWIVIALRLRRSYVAELDRSIAEGKVEVGSWHEAVAGAETLRAVRQALASRHEPAMLAALELVADNPHWELGESLGELARSGSLEVRARALAILLDPQNPELPEGVTRAFELEDQELLARCIDLRLAETADERRARAEAILERAGGPARGAWIALMVRRLGPEFQPVARGLLEELVAPASPVATREVAATAIGLLHPASGVADLLPPLLADPEPQVASAAVRSAAAVGRAELMRAAVPLLGTVATRRAARRALQSRGDEVIPVLMNASTSPTLDRRARLRIPAVLAGIGSSKCLPALTSLMASEDRGMAQAASDALYRIRLRKPELSLIPERDARRLVLGQARRCGKLFEQLQALGTQDGPQRTLGWDLLVASLRSAYQIHHAAIFRLLCLCYSPRHILNCRRSLLEPNLELKANAAELLDNLVPRSLWRELLPLLYREEFGTSGEGRSRPPADPGAVVVELAEGGDPWLRACALNLAGELGLAQARGAAERAAADGEAHVREAAGRALARIEGRDSGVNAMTVVEKVVALRTIEIFREIPPSQLALIASVAREETFPPDHVLARQNDPPGDLYVLLGGRVALERDGAPLGELGRGDALGAWALFDDEPLQITARTREETPALRIDRGGFEELVDEHPEIARALIQHLIRRLRKLAE